MTLDAGQARITVHVTVEHLHGTVEVVEHERVNSGAATRAIETACDRAKVRMQASVDPDRVLA